jgi:hypothetical protein
VGTRISTNNPLNIFLEKDTSLKAIFEAAQIELVVNSAGNGSVSPSGKSNRDCNIAITITATPDVCYKFKN